MIALYLLHENFEKSLSRVNFIRNAIEFPADRTINLAKKIKKLLHKFLQSNLFGFESKYNDKFEFY